MIPTIGKWVVGKRTLEYLTKSIQDFINQEELLDLMKKIIFISVLIKIYLVE